MSSFRRTRRILRSALLTLLMLGLVINPVLAAVGELHGLEHAAMAASAGLHDHAHQEGSDHPHPGDDADPEHASGLHGLLHQTGSVSETLPEGLSALLVQLPPEADLPEFGMSHRPGDSPNLPFRPPIA